MAKENSRTTNTIYNFITGVGIQLLTNIMQFAVRTVFIGTLGKAYLGIGGLFSNILTMFSLAEFGVSNAVLFKLYEPLATQDRRRIALLMRLHERLYSCIGAVVAALGVCMIPFLPLLIKDYDKLEELGINAAFIFILYLLQAVSSYLFWAYKNAIICADQKGYLINIINCIITAALSIVQIFSLILFHSFEVYVVLHIAGILSQNYACAKMADRIYPYINDPVADQISKKELTGMVKDCGAQFLYKMNHIVLKATDNIVISMFLGLEAVGIYSNYYVLYNAIGAILSKIFNSVLHSLGSLHTTHNIKHEYEVFQVINLIAVVLGGTAGVGIFVVANEFVDMWIGSGWVIAQPFSLLMGLELYTLSFQALLGRYRIAMGLFQPAKFRPLAGMAINLIVSVLLVKRIGICGVLLGTVIADWTTLMWFDPMVIHKHGFKNTYSVLQYYLKNIKYVAIVAVTAVFDRIVCTHLLTGLGWASVILHAGICGVTVPAAIILCASGTDEGKYVCSFTVKVLKKICRVTKIRGRAYEESD